MDAHSETTTRHISRMSLLKCYARILFTDLSKGFDLVDHSVLVSELRDLGVHEALIRWIGAFLTGRSQQVKIGSALSNSVIPRSGIPQGTRLAPLLFAILVKPSEGLEN